MRDNNGNHALTLTILLAWVLMEDLNATMVSGDIPTLQIYSIGHLITVRSLVNQGASLANLLSSRRFLAGISYHTPDGMCYTFGYLMIGGSDSYELRTLAQEMPHPKHNSTNQCYGAMPSWQLYPVSGSSDDWIYGDRCLALRWRWQRHLFLTLRYTSIT